MKADVIHTLTGMTVRVNALTQLQKALEVLREESVRELRTAFYMDLMTNKLIQTSYYGFTALLSEMGLHFGT